MDRKRASEDAPAVASEAKRVHLDGDEAAPEYALLEVRGLLTQQFRKEAIYRQLREARRDAQRAHDTAHTLEARVAQLQESVQCVNQFWDTLREVLRALHVDEHVLGAALQSALVQSAPLALEQSAAEHARGLQDAQARQAQLAAESSTLRAALAAAHAQLSAAQADAARVTEALRAAQKAADRRESASVRAVEDPLGKARADAEAAQIAAANAERAEAERRKDTADAASADGGAPNAALEEELVTQRELAAARLEELGELRAEVGALQQQLAGVSAQLASLPDERVAAHPLFHQAQADMVLLQHEAERLRAECAAVVHENEQLREFRVEFQHQTATQANTHCDELQKQLRARDADIVRLRGQRDELNAELLERRARDTIKFAQVDELKALVAPKDERIEALRAQVHRLGVVLGALRGETGAHGAADGVADADADVARATADGAALRAAAAADAADATPDALRHALTQVRAELEAANASTASLYDEVDRLSAAYDALDKQANAKLVNLAKLEDKIVRLTTEKSKADNKYFAAMRAKDAVEAELRTLARSTERQGKVIERYTDTEKGLQQQLMQAEKETSALRRAVQTHATKLAEAERDRSVLKRRAAELERGKAAAESSGAAHLASLNDERGARTRAEERAAILDKEVSRLKRRVADRDAGGAVRKRGAGDENTHLAYLDSLLKCSACKERYRDRIITKCLHTFCEACVNARIQTRQRKCPHCGLCSIVRRRH
ncbi:BRE1 [Malassezia furfur]|nr:BRE1 [Malassezia furfur]